MCVVRMGHSNTFCLVEDTAGYNALKLAHHGQPMDVYRTAKDTFITRVLDAASRP